MKSSVSRLPAAVLLFACAIWAPPAAAALPPQDSTFSPQQFHPAIGPDEFITVEPAMPLPHLNTSLGLWLNYSRDPFALLNVDRNGPGSTRAHVIADQLGLDLVFAIGLWNRLQIGVGLPVTVYQGGDDNTTLRDNGVPFTLKVPTAFSLGDPWLDVKVRVLGLDEGINVSLAATISAPLSQATPQNNVDSTGNFGGDAGVDIGGRALAGWEAERWRAGVSFGFLWRQQKSKFFNSSVGEELQYGAAFAWDAVANRKVTLVGEVHGHVDLSNVDPASGGFTISDINGNTLELDVAIKPRLSRSWFATVGLGTGIIKGLGSPLARIFAGVTWAPDRRDRDHDGVPDAEDKCPDVPEDRDGFQDQDGCPDPDNDGDGIPDERDRCPNEAEDKDGFQDEDGCPDPDNDNDGIPDTRDLCPLDPEDHKPPKPNDGCPLGKSDTDEDGVQDDKDKCPLEQEDRDGFQDDDGCIDPDNDNDDIPDAFDKCPNEPEDVDGFEDDDGCPDPDNDRDGFLDKVDKCPNQPETINGYMDEDGCPDRGPPLKVQVVGDEIVVLEKVYFKTAKAIIVPKSWNLLDQVATILKLTPRIRKVQIQGHTDGKGLRAKNMILSQQRADAVRNYEIRKGVAGDRLVARGFGPDVPVADNKSERGREANRRVQFIILEQDRRAAEPTAAPVDPAPTAPNE